MQTYAVRPFIAEIARIARLGYGFVPFIGSGFSASSGIMMGQEFTDYLAYATALSVKRLKDRPKAWSFRRDGWPPNPDEEQIAEAREWILDSFQQICRRSGIYANADASSRITDLSPLAPGRHASAESALLDDCPFVPALLCSSRLWKSERERIAASRLRRPDDWMRAFRKPYGYSPTSVEHIEELAIRSLYDWRITLDFLSRVDVDPIDERLVLADRAQSVIDGFNVHITADKQNNLGHKMLAHLVRPLRIRTILTTNFDDLIEQALERVQNEFTVIPVSLRGELPDPKTVRANDCVIKLHGSRVETRADLSLDDLPTPEEFDRFVEIVTGRSSDGAGEVRCSLPARILVIGFSGQDQRCIQLMKACLEADPECFIYWVCFSRGDVDRLKDVFFERSLRGRLRVCLTQRPDLLLYELYQEITLCLPSGGFSYEYTHKAPPVRQRRLELAAFDATEQEDVLSVTALRKALTIEDAAVSAENLAKSEGDNLGSPYKEAVLRHAVAAQVGQEIAQWVDRGVPPSTESAGWKSYAALRTYRDGKQKGEMLIVNVSSGVVEAANYAFERLARTSKKLLWFELQDHCDPRQTLRDLLTSMALSQGLFQLEHVDLLPPSATGAAHGGSSSGDPSFDGPSLRKHLRAICKYLRIKPENWALFFYGRNYPGECAGWKPVPWSNGSNTGITSDGASKQRPGNQLNDLRVLLCELSRAGFRCVYMPHVEGRQRMEKDKIDEIHNTSLEDLNTPRKIAGQSASAAKEKARTYESDRADPAVDVERGENPRVLHSFHPPEFVRDDRLNNPGPTFAESFKVLTEEWIRGALRDPDRDERDDGRPSRTQSLGRIQFLYAMSLFRQSRHFSAFLSQAAFVCPNRFNVRGIDNDELRAAHVRQWLNELRDKGVLLEKPGGYCWLHRDMRLSIQHLIQNLRLTDLGENAKNGYDSFAQVRARTHFWIGDWYVKAFASSGNAIPAIEALHHYFRSAMYAHWATPRRGEESDENASSSNAPADEETIAQPQIATEQASQQKAAAQEDSQPEVSKPEEPTSAPTENWEMQVRTYRLNQFEQAVDHILKTLLLSSDLLSFWLTDRTKHPMFDEHAAEIVECDLHGQLERLRTNFDDLPADQVDRKGLDNRCARILNAIARVKEGILDVGARIASPFGNRSSIPRDHSRMYCRFGDRPHPPVEEGRGMAWREIVRKLFDGTLDVWNKKGKQGKATLHHDDWLTRIAPRVGEHFISPASLAKSTPDANDRLNLAECLKDLDRLRKVARKAVPRNESPKGENPKKKNDLWRPLQRSLKKTKLEKRLRAAVSKHESDDAVFTLDLTSLFGELAYACIRTAKTLHHAASKDDKAPLEGEEERWDDWSGRFPLWLQSVPFRSAERGLSACATDESVWSRFHLASSERFRDLVAVWLQATILCNAGLRVASKVDPSLFEQECRLTIKLQTMYGLSLANLDRYAEAHRHLNEAMGLLSKSTSAHRHDPVELAVIRLRRAEIYLTECTSTLKLVDLISPPDVSFLPPELNPKELEGLSAEEAEAKRSKAKTAKTEHEKTRRKREGEGADLVESLMQLVNPRSGRTLPTSLHIPDNVHAALLEVKRLDGDAEQTRRARLCLRLLRLCCAALDDAWAMLEDAERGLAGRSHSSHWWGRLYTLQLRTFSLADAIETRYAKAYRTESDLRSKGAPPSSRPLERASIRPLVRRKSIQHDAHEGAVFEKAQLALAGSPYRQLRAVEYILGDPVAAEVRLRRWRDAKGSLSKSLSSAVDKTLKALKLAIKEDPCTRRRGFLKRYFKRVRQAYRDAQRRANSASESVGRTDA